MCCFDPSGGEYHDNPLAGDTLVDGEYVPIEVVAEPGGRHRGYSEILEMELWWDVRGSYVSETLRAGSYC